MTPEMVRAIEAALAKGRREELSGADRRNPAGSAFVFGGAEGTDNVTLKESKWIQAVLRTGE